ncbi:putative dehydratase; 2-methylcitrate dehydratase (PrpD)family [Cupriavidus taiwanensis]|uniref:Dehydratase 2-methylcitrate dehydratase (PrpD)family n=2 Tax=Cupriavidus taiwanensis TaxID=164546 RepID=A0A975XIL8_9BURK|nr:putative dehydratase; 2-methylcitrate dehydratase (PrpD)family [Cupriavidus taiwanensis]
MPRSSAFANTGSIDNNTAPANAAMLPVEPDHTFDNTADRAGFTRALADWTSTVDDAELGAPAFAWARHAMLDWIAVTLAAAREPLVEMLVAEYAGLRDLPCALVGSPLRAEPAQAALINGAAGHALDFDDVASAMHGHPTVPVAPAALAVAQAAGASGKDLLRALILGHEVESRVGAVVGAEQYRLGLHPTGTTGTLGAAAACARLGGLDPARTAHALGLAATQAAGLKCMFGTMAKPLHAGKAAMNGVMAARLAARGFTANASGIECEQGFGRTQAPAAPAFPATFERRAAMAIERTLFKFHASCYLTHSTIEAVRQACREHRIDLDALESMTISVSGPHRGVCDIANPQTGLEIKFAIQHLAALAMDGAPTASLALYSPETALAPRYVRARQRIALQVVPGPDRNAATVEILTRDGRTLRAQANVAVPAADLAMQWRRLVDKAQAIVVPRIGAAKFAKLVSVVDTLDQLPSVEPLFESMQ